MIANENKMPVVLIGNSFKYEIESILKLFFNTARFNFTDDRAAASGEAYFVAEVAPDALYAEVKLKGDESVKASAPLGKDEDENEFELCRMIYHILCDKTGVVPPWGWLRESVR